MTYSYIYWSSDCGKSQLVLDLKQKNTTSIVTTSSLSDQGSDGIRCIIIKIGSDLMTKFDSLNQKNSYINEYRSCHYYLNVQLHYSLYNHYLWLLTQSYPPTLKSLRRQAKTIFVWFLEVRAHLKR